MRIRNRNTVCSIVFFIRGSESWNLPPAVLWIRIRSRIRIRSDPELFAGSGSGINHFGSGSGLIPNFSVKKPHFFIQIAQKIRIFST
jgi:hypothetical protein